MGPGTVIRRRRNRRIRRGSCGGVVSVLVCLVRRGRAMYKYHMAVKQRGLYIKNMCHFLQVYFGDVHFRSPVH